VSSPWRLALGDRFESLDPGLRVYFSELPPGRIGRGTGVFEAVGTPRRWLWPVLAILARAGIAFPVWEHEVPFEVRNTPVGTAVRATLVFGFARGHRVMRHAIGMTDRGLVDLLGTRGRLEAELRASVRDGRLELRSTRTLLCVGRWRFPIVGAPRVTLVERADGARQRVELTLTAPLVGRIYEYAGTFEYTLEDA
jgi:hypothetical protein